MCAEISRERDESLMNIREMIFQAEESARAKVVGS